MRYYFLLSITLLSHLVGYTQNTRPKTLIDSSPEHISGFGSIMFSVAPLSGEYSVLSGGGGAVLVDRTFFIGGYGQSTSTDLSFMVEEKEYRSDFGHGGIWFGYLFRPNEVFHLGLDTKLGWGSIENRLMGDPEGNHDDDVFVFFPQLLAALNVSYWCKASAGLGYQKLIGVDRFIYEPSGFSGPAFSLGLQFGWFD